MNTFKINEKEYTAKPFDFNLVCDLEDMGVPMQQAADKPMSMLRAYFALCARSNITVAGQEMEAHVLGGGKFDDVTNAMTIEMDKSDFFRNLSKGEKEETAENQEKKKQEK